MVQEADYLELQNSQILNLFSMLLETEKIEKDPLGLYGLRELMLLQGS